MALAGIGLAVGGLVRPSLAAPVTLGPRADVLPVGPDRLDRRASRRRSSTSRSTGTSASRSSASSTGPGMAPARCARHRRDRRSARIGHAAARHRAIAPALGGQQRTRRAPLGSGVPTLAIALVLVAAVLHAGWNVLLKTSGDTLWTAVRLQAIGTAILLPIGIVAWFANGRPAVPPDGDRARDRLGRARGGLLRAACPRRTGGAPSRSSTRSPAGSAPLLAVARRDRRCSASASLRWRSSGSRCLLAGILLVARPWQAFRAAGASTAGAIGFALATGASIAAYSAVDRLGVRLTEPWLYGAILAVVATDPAAIAVVVGRRLGLLAPAPAGADGARRRARAATASARLARDALAGVLALSAYLLVLFAYAHRAARDRRAAARIGHRARRGVGRAPARRGAGRREAATRIAAAGLVVVGAILLARRALSAGPARRARASRRGLARPPDRQAARPQIRRSPNRLLTSATPPRISAVPTSDPRRRSARRTSSRR